jgi:hypothetical protein
LINAIRLATADQLHLSSDEWMEVFAHLLAKADRKTGATSLVTGGIGTRRLITLAHHAIDYLTNNYGIELTISRPLIERPFAVELHHHRGPTVSCARPRRRSFSRCRADSRPAPDSRF